MNEKYNLAKSLLPIKIQKIAFFLKENLEAIEVSKEDQRLKFILDDVYCPATDSIKGVYVIYKKSILELLEGRIDSIHSYEFLNASNRERMISEEDIEYVLDTAAVVVLASKDDETLSTYFIAGTVDKLNSILHLCQGYSKDFEDKKFKNSLQRFITDIKIVEQMGLLEELIEIE